MKKLSKKELDELKGGIDMNAPGGDITNHNTVNGCVCYYTDHSVINNVNDVSGCSCSCSSN